MIDWKTNQLVQNNINRVESLTALEFSKEHMLKQLIGLESFFETRDILPDHTEFDCGIDFILKKELSKPIKLHSSTFREKETITNYITVT